MAEPKIGIALGSGGAKALAHVPLLEAMEDAGVRPRMIAGASMGALIGYLYASGIPAKELREQIEELFLPDSDGLLNRFRDLVRPLVDDARAYLDLGMAGRNLMDPDRLLTALSDATPARTFDDLDIPLKIVASDFWEREEVVLDSGDIIRAVHASMALPGLLDPVAIDGRVLVDGAAVNPVPYSHLLEECDRVIAVNVMGQRTYTGEEPPGLTEAVFNTFQIMQRSILACHLARRPPDLLLEPEIADVRIYEFSQAQRILDAAGPAKAELARFLRETLGRG